MTQSNITVSDIKYIDIKHIIDIKEEPVDADSTHEDCNIGNDLNSNNQDEVTLKKELVECECDIPFPDNVEDGLDYLASTPFDLVSNILVMH